MKAEDGAKFKAGRMGEYTITKDPTRAKGLRVLMGPFSIYDKTNVEAAAKWAPRRHRPACHSTPAFHFRAARGRGCR